LRWGEAFTGEPDTSESLTLTLAICPRSLEAQSRLGGLLPAVKATTEKGAQLEAPKVVGAFFGSRFARFGADVVVPVTQQVSLPAPTDGSLTLSKLEGALRIFPDAKSITLEFTADSKGKTFELGKDTLTVEDWNQQGTMLLVVLRRTATKTRVEQTVPLGVTEVGRAPVLATSLSPADQTPVAVGKNGAEYAPQTASVQGGPDGTLKIQYGFPNAADIVCVRFTTVAFGDAEEQVPFVIENIPLP
jgi:hypothetical protein